MNPEEILTRFYPDIEIEKRVLPFSEELLKRTGDIFSVGSNLLQRIFHFTHNPFDITVFLERIEDLPKLEPAALSAVEVRRSFAQFFTVRKAAVENNLDFIDFNGCRITASGDLRFPLLLEEGNSWTTTEMVNYFQNHGDFADLTEDDCRSRLSGKFGEIEVQRDGHFMYRFDLFSSRMLGRYSFEEIGERKPIQITIQTGGKNERDFIKSQLVHRFLCEGIQILDGGVDGQSLIPHLRELVTGETKEENDWLALVENFKTYLEGHPNPAFVLILDSLEGRRSAGLVKYLIEALRTIPCSMVVLARTTHIDADLILKENARNLLSPDGGAQKSIPKARQTKGEREVMKIFKILGIPISEADIKRILSPEEKTLTARLVKRGYLKEMSGKIGLNTRETVLKSHRDGDEALDILSRAAKKLSDPFFKLKYGVLSGKFRGLREYILTTCSLESENCEESISLVKHFFLTHLDKIREHEDALLEVAAFFIGMRDVGSARLTLGKRRPNSSPALNLKWARIFCLERDYKSMDKELSRVGPSLNEALNDEFYYLRFIANEKRLKFGAADRCLKKTTGELYLNLAHVLLADRYIYNAQFEKAEEMLAAAGNFLKRWGYLGDEIEARSQNAKLLREKGDIPGAERLYKRLFIRSQIAESPLLSGYVALDLGNLYWNQDRFAQAESWYRKAHQIFRDAKHQNGRMLVASNLAELDKYNGDWPEAERMLRSILRFDKNKQYTGAMAIDWYNIAHLEYLRRNYPRALDHLGRARALFEKKKGLNGITACEVLEAKVRLLRGDRYPPTDWLGKNISILSLDQKVVLEVLKVLKCKTAPTEEVFLNLLAKVDSKVVCFDLFTLLVQLDRITPGVARYRRLSVDLSPRVKNYFYHEYQWTRFDVRGTSADMSDQDKEVFMEMFYFFLRNKRRISQKIFLLKKEMEERDAVHEVFKKAELVEDYRGWEIPADFFRSFIQGLGGRIKSDLIKLRIFEKGETLFDFCQGGGFSELGAELITYAVSSAGHLNLDQNDIKTHFQSAERLFFPYKNTKVYLWRLSDPLFAVLLLAFREDHYAESNLLERHADYFQTMASLFARYYENDYRLDQSLSFIAGESTAMKRLKKQIDRVSRVDFSLLITGGSGSGKELVAKGVHRLSDRCKKPFVPVNAAAIPATLLEAELFGFKKGAFTGAAESKLGLFEAAHGGTLFLDEIADLPLDLQSKVLRVLQEKEIRRVGETRSQAVDVRLISATNKDLEKLIAQGTFREDLFFRIQDIQIRVPSLDERKEDIPLLTRFFLDKYGFTPAGEGEIERIVCGFMARDWKGNVRELESQVKRWITFYPDEDGNEESPDSMEDSGLLAARAGFEKSFLVQALKDNNWNKAKTARGLGISRVYLFDLIKKYGIKRE